MRRVVAAVWVLVLSMGCGSTTEPAPQSGWEELTQLYLEEFFELHPVAASAAGRHEYDGLLPDLSQPGFHRFVATLELWRSRIEEVEPGTLNKLQRFERDLLLFEIRRHIYLIAEERRPFRNIAYYRGLLSPDRLVTGSYAPAEDRALALTRWAEAIPTALAQMRETIESPMPEPFVDLAGGFFYGMARHLQNHLVGEFGTLGDADQQARFGTAMADATEALNEMGDWSEAQRGMASDGYALSAPGFQRMLQMTEQIDMPLAELIRLGEEDLDRNLTMVRQACTAIAPDLALYECVHQANGNKPEGGPVARGAAQLVELKAFLIDQDLVSIPSDEEALVREAPEHRRSNLAYIRGPGAFETARIPSIYYIAPPDPDWSPEQQRAYIPGEAQLLFVSAHEVWPGHFLQGLHRRANDSPIVRYVRSYANSEGWAHYTEQMMWEAGLRSDPASQIGYLMGSLTRNARYLAAIGLHTGEMSLAEAQQLFTQRGLTSEGRAIRQAARGTYDPEYLKYTLGKMMILQMRDRWLDQHGPDSLKAFHDAFLTYGSAPLPMIERAMFADG